MALLAPFFAELLSVNLPEPDSGARAVERIVVPKIGD